MVLYGFSWHIWIPCITHLLLWHVFRKILVAWRQTWQCPQDLIGKTRGLPLEGLGSVYSVDALNKGITHISGLYRVSSCCSESSKNWNLWVAYFWNFSLNALHIKWLCNWDIRMWSSAWEQVHMYVFWHVLTAKPQTLLSAIKSSLIRMTTKFVIFC